MREVLQTSYVIQWHFTVVMSYMCVIFAVHFYDDKMNPWVWSNFPTPRFASEYGLQSWTSFESLQSVTEPKDWDQASDFSNHRQHHPNGEFGI